MVALRIFDEPRPRVNVADERETLRDERERETDRIREEQQEFDDGRRYTVSERGCD